MSLVDAFMYHGEEAAVTIRLHTLQPDVCVVVEGSCTFQGTPNPFRWSRSWQQRFPDIRFVHRKVAIPFSDSTWKRETALRNALGEAVLAVARPEDRVFLSDADEFISRRRADLYPTDLWHFDPQRYYWTVDWGFEDRGRSALPFLCTAKELEWRTAQDLRYSPTAVSPHGWEFSFLGDPGFAVEKFQSFAHSELNTEEITSWTRIENAIKFGLDPSPYRGATLVPREPNDSRLPRWVLENPEWVHRNKLSRFDW